MLQELLSPWSLPGSDGPPISPYEFVSYLGDLFLSSSLSVLHNHRGVDGGWRVDKARFRQQTEGRWLG